MTRNAHPIQRFRARSAATPTRRPTPARLRRGTVPPAHEGWAPGAQTAEVSVEVLRGGARPVVVVSGELDLVGMELLEAVLTHVRATSPGSVGVDLSGVSFVDTHGLSPALASDVVLVAASPPVTRVLGLMGFPGPASP